MDYLLERKNLEGKDISVPAQKLFYRALQCEFFIVISDLTATELNYNLELEQALILFAFLKKKIVNVYKAQEDIEEAKRINPTNYSDALHAILARKAEADILVTRNTEHFKEFSWIKAKSPENI